MIVSLVHWKNRYIPALKELLCEKIYECRDRQEALRVLPDADIVITFGGGDGDYAIPIDGEMLAAAHGLRLVLSLSSGVEKLPMQALREKNVAVCNSRGAHGVSIAEYVLGGMLVMSHHFHQFLRSQEQSRWKPIVRGEDLEGGTLCVIGAGSIGREIARKAKAFDMNVIGIKRRPEPVCGFDRVWGADRLHEALALSDYVVMVAPLTSETYHMMGEAEFRRMKETAIFINVSRGDTVDESALIRALTEKTIAGAVLDVFHEEPLPPESPLWGMENVLVTPHCSGPTKNTQRKTIRLIYDNIVRYRQGGELINLFAENQTY